MRPARRDAASFPGEDGAGKADLLLQGTEMKTRFITLAFAAALGLSAAQSAYAQVDEALLERLKSFSAEQGTTLDWQDAEDFTDADGNDGVRLVNARFGSGDEEVVVSELELSDVSEDGGSWRIGSVRVPSQEFSEDGSVVALSDFSIDGLVLPPEGDTEATPMYDAAALGAMTVTSGGKEVFTLTDFHVETTLGSGGPVGFTGAADAFSVNIDGIEDASSREMIRAMGYESLEGSFEFAGSWHPEDGTLELSQYDVTIDDAGTFGIKLQLGGYTRDFLAALRQVQQMSAGGGDDSAAGMAMLGLLQQLTFHSARIEFTDDTLTSRALEYVAAQQGASPADIANQAKAVVPFMLMQLNNPELVMSATQAVSAFLDDPQNLAITAQPATPMPFALLFAGAMSAPQALPQQLGVKVIANE